MAETIYFSGMVKVWGSLGVLFMGCLKGRRISVRCRVLNLELMVEAIYANSSG